MVGVGVEVEVGVVVVVVVVVEVGVGMTTPTRKTKLRQAELRVLENAEIWAACRNGCRSYIWECDDLEAAVRALQKARKEARK